MTTETIYYLPTARMRTIEKLQRENSNVVRLPNAIDETKWLIFYTQWNIVTIWEYDDNVKSSKSIWFVTLEDLNEIVSFLSSKPQS